MNEANQMRAIAGRAVASGLIAIFTVGLALDAASRDMSGEQAYQSCAACHLPDGAGVPGAFPPIAGRLAPLAETDPGREYLVLVVSAGLMGPITVDGATYHGAMPGQATLLDDAGIAAALNYVLQISEASPAKSELSAFTAKEVAEIRARHPGATGSIVYEMRSRAWAMTDRPE